MPFVSVFLSFEMFRSVKMRISISANIISLTSNNKISFSIFLQRQVSIISRPKIRFIYWSRAVLMWYKSLFGGFIDLSNFSFSGFLARIWTNFNFTICILPHFVLRADNFGQGLKKNQIFDDFLTIFYDFPSLTTPTVFSSFFLWVSFKSVLYSTVDLTNTICD